ncbi:hypothetical protein EON65_34275 [archaeon]|nr:MAG: hypothetical protein EON65_34275 [archaeon]
MQRYSLDLYKQQAKQGLYNPPSQTDGQQRKRYNFTYLQSVIEERFTTAMPPIPGDNANHIYLRNLHHQLHSRQQKHNSKVYKAFAELFREKVEEEVEEIGRCILTQQNDGNDGMLSEEMDDMERRSSSGFNSSSKSIKPLFIICIECIVSNLPITPPTFTRPSISELPPSFEQLMELIPGLPPEQVEYISFCLGVCGQLSLSTYPSLLLPLLQDQLALPPLHLPPQLSLYPLLELLQRLQAKLRDRGQTESSWERLLEQAQPLPPLPHLLPRLLFLPGYLLQPSELLLLGRHGLLGQLQQLQFVHADIASQDSGVDEDSLLLQYPGILSTAAAASASDTAPVLGYSDGGSRGSMQSRRQDDVDGDDEEEFFFVASTSASGASSSSHASNGMMASAQCVDMFSLLLDMLADDPAASQQLRQLNAAGRQAVCLLCLLSSARYVPQLRTVRFAYCHFITDQVLQVWFQLLVRMKAASISTGSRENGSVDEEDARKDVEDGADGAQEGVSSRQQVLLPLAPLHTVILSGLQEAIAHHVSSNSKAPNRSAGRGNSSLLQQEAVRDRMIQFACLINMFESQLGITVLLK